MIDLATTAYRLLLELPGQQREVPLTHVHSGESGTTSFAILGFPGRETLRDRIAAALFAHDVPVGEQWVDTTGDVQATYLSRADAVLRTIA